MHGRDASVWARGHHREAALTAYRRQQQRRTLAAFETILLLDSPPRFRVACRLGRMRFEESARRHDAATLRNRLLPHTRIRPHRRFQARVVHGALLPFNGESPGQTLNNQLVFRPTDDRVNACTRERIFARLNLCRHGFASHRTRRPIGLRVHRRIRLQLAHNFRNLIPRNDREPSAHDEPPLLLLRVRPAALDFQLYVFAIRIKKGAGISFTLYDFRDSYNLARVFKRFFIRFRVPYKKRELCRAPVLHALLKGVGEAEASRWETASPSSAAAACATATSLPYPSCQPR